MQPGPILKMEDGPALFERYDQRRQREHWRKHYQRWDGEGYVKQSFAETAIHVERSVFCYQGQSNKSKQRHFRRVESARMMLHRP